MSQNICIYRIFVIILYQKQQQITTLNKHDAIKITIVMTMKVGL